MPAMTKLKLSIAKNGDQIRALAHKQQKQTGAMNWARQERSLDQI